MPELVAETDALAVWEVESVFVRVGAGVTVTVKLLVAETDGVGVGTKDRVGDTECVVVVVLLP